MLKLSIQKPVALIGLMGSGKTVIGKKLSKKLNIRCYDTDKLIEDREGLSIVDIYEFKGKKYFEKKEEEVIEEILSYGKIILSVGGNSFKNDNVRELIQEKTTTVWLKADFDVLLERVSRRNTRPELNNANKEEILQRMIDEQYPLFENADIIVESKNSDIYTIVNTIIERLEQS